MKKLLIALLMSLVPAVVFAGTQQIRNVVGMAKASSTKLSVGPDTFTGVSNTLLPAYSANWMSDKVSDGIYSTPKIYTNVAVGSSSRIGIAYWSTSDDFSDDQKVCADMTMTPSTTVYGGPAARVQPGDVYTLYAVQAYETYYRLVKVVNSTVTVLGSTTAGTYSIGDITCILTNGSTISATKNGSEIMTSSDSTITGGQPGLLLRGGSLDNWTGEDL